MDHALYSNNTGLTKEDKQNLDDPATLDALHFISRIATEKLARPTEGGDWTEPGQFFRQGNTLMYAGALHELSGMQTDMPDYDIGFVPFRKGRTQRNTTLPKHSSRRLPFRKQSKIRNSCFISGRKSTTLIPYTTIGPSLVRNAILERRRLE